MHRITNAPRPLALARLLTLAGLLALAAVTSMPAPAAAEDAKPVDGKPPAKVTYDEQVRAIFREHCFTCHNQDTKKSDLSLASFASAMQGGSTGQVIEPGDPGSSRLWALVSHQEEPNMPPNQDKLPAAKLDVIKAWIEGGALENNGSVAKVKKQPGLEMTISSGAAKPEGPPPMPEGLSRQPVVYTARAAAVTAMAASPWAPLVAVAGQQQIVLYNTDTAQLLGVLPFPEGMPHVLKFSRSGTLLLAGGGIGAKPRQRRGLRREDRASAPSRSARNWTPCWPPTSTKTTRASPWADRAGSCAFTRRPTARWCTKSASTPNGSTPWSSAPTACCWPRPTATAACSYGRPKRPANIRTWPATRRA